MKLRCIYLILWIDRSRKLEVVDVIRIGPGNVGSRGIADCLQWRGFGLGIRASPLESELTRRLMVDHVHTLIVRFVSAGQSLGFPASGEPRRVEKLITCIRRYIYRALIGCLHVID